MGFYLPFPGKTHFWPGPSGLKWGIPWRPLWPKTFLSARVKLKLGFHPVVGPKPGFHPVSGPKQGFSPRRSGPNPAPPPFRAKPVPRAEHVPFCLSQAETGFLSRSRAETGVFSPHSGLNPVQLRCQAEQCFFGPGCTWAPGPNLYSHSQRPR